MIADTDSQPPVPSAGDRDAESNQPAPGGGSTVDEMSEWSFPASDPPAVWTWELKAPATDADPTQGR